MQSESGDGPRGERARARAQRGDKRDERGAEGVRGDAARERDLAPAGGGHRAAVHHRRRRHAHADPARAPAPGLARLAPEPEPAARPLRPPRATQGEWPEGRRREAGGRLMNHLASSEEKNHE